MAGPIARPTLKVRLDSATAWPNSSVGTRSGWMACQAGLINAAPTPSANVSPSSSAGVTRSVNVNTAEAAAQTSIQACVEQQDGAPVEDVGDGSGRQPEEQDRQQAGGLDQCHQGRRRGQVAHQPGRGDGLEERADVRAELSGEQRGEDVVAQRCPWRPAWLRWRRHDVHRPRRLFRASFCGFGPFVPMRRGAVPARGLARHGHRARGDGCRRAGRPASGAARRARSPDGDGRRAGGGGARRGHHEDQCGPQRRFPRHGTRCVADALAVPVCSVRDGRSDLLDARSGGQ